MENFNTQTVLRMTQLEFIDFLEILQEKILSK